MSFNKHWKSISVALLIAISGIGMANHNGVHADSNNSNTSKQTYSPQASDGNTLIKANPVQSEAHQSNFTQQANSLHNQIVQNNASPAFSASANTFNNDADLNFELPDFDDSFNNLNSDFSDMLTNTKSEASSLSAETSEANHMSHPNYQMSFSSTSNSSAFGYNYYFASSASDNSTSNSLVNSISTDINDNIDNSFNWMNSMDNQMNSEFNAVNDTFGEDNFDNNSFTHQPVLEPSSNESSSSNSANNANLNSQDNNNYNNFAIPNNNRSWNYVMNGTNGVPDYGNNSNNYSDSDNSINDILNQINDLTNELNNDINSWF